MQEVAFTYSPFETRLSIDSSLHHLDWRELFAFAAPTAAPPHTTCSHCQHNLKLKRTVRNVFEEGKNNICYPYQSYPQEGHCLTACARLGLRARAALSQHGRLRSAEGLSPTESCEPSPGPGSLAWAATRWRLLIRPGDCVKGPLCARTSRPEQRGLLRSSVPRNQGCSHPCAEPAPAVPHGRDGTEQLPHCYLHPGYLHPGYLHPANQAQVQACGIQAKTVDFLTLTYGRTPNTWAERAKETSSHLN